MGNRILILNGDSTQAIPLILSFHKSGHIVDVVCHSKYGYGSSSKYVNKKYYWKNSKEHKEYSSFLLSIIKEERYLTIIPCDDEAATVLSKYKDELLEYTQYVAPDYDVYTRGYDKHLLMELCQLKGYPHPKTYTIKGDSLDDIDVDNLPYPILIKPNYTSGARGITYITTKEELLEKLPIIYNEYGECHLQQFIPVGGSQVKVQLYINEKKELIQSSVIEKYRWYPENGGSSCCNVSCVNPKIVDICYSILKDLDWVGFADFDTIENPLTGELLIMEINPRLPACIKSAFVSGVDWADVLISEYLHKPHKFYQVKEGLWLRHLGFEILWFLYSKNRFKTKPSWFKFFGKNIYYQDMSSFTDPMPFIKGTLGNVMKQLSPEFRKSKSGTR